MLFLSHNYHGGLVVLGEMVGGHCTLITDENGVTQLSSVQAFNQHVLALIETNTC